MRWAYVFKGDEEITLSRDGCHFLESEITNVETKTKEQEMAGMDGVLVGSNTFGSFELTLKFFYEGVDKDDLMLFTEKIKSIIHAREPMYIVHSDMPGRKYAFNSAKIEWEKITPGDVTFSIVFNIYKGYSESLKDTSDITFLTDYWQFENGVITDEDIQYKFYGKRFTVWNGSNDTIDPLMDHNLVIRIKGSGSNGFTIRNHHTGDVFQYFGSLASYKTFEINGVHPVIDDNRVGYDTNYDWIRLQPGFNNIEIEGNGFTLDSVEFIFNFVYR